MSSQVFLSHSVASADKPLLEHVEHECAQLGIELYLAEREFAPTTVTDKIRGAIQSSDCVIVLLTAAGKASSWVNQEIAIANEMEKPIVPLLEEGVEAPGLIRERDQIRYRRGSFKDAFDRAVRFIGTLREKSTQASPPSEGDAFFAGVIVGAAIVVVIGLVLLALSEQ